MPVRALYHSRKPAKEYNNVEWFQADVLDITAMEDAFEGVTHVYHCAAMVSYDPRYHDAMMAVNVEGTANVVNLSLDYNIRKLVFVSSIASLGKDDTQFITEKTEWKKEESLSKYSESKYLAEMEVWRGIAEGLEAVILNPGIILGEGDWNQSSTNLFKIVYDEFPFYTKGATAWVDVNDLVAVMIRVMKENIINDKFIVSAGNYTYKEIFDTMATHMNKKKPHILARPWMISIVWRWQYLKALLFGTKATITRETAQSAQSISNFDNTKLLTALPDFQYVSMETSIKRIAASFM